MITPIYLIILPLATFKNKIVAIFTAGLESFPKSTSGNKQVNQPSDKRGQ